MTTVHQILADISINPDPRFFGMTTLQLVINGFAALVFLAMAVFFLLGVIELNAGHVGGNPWQMSHGKTRIWTSILGAVLVGGAAAILNFAWHFGATNLT